MTRRHRTFHRLLWPVLAVAVGFAFAMALALRPPPEAAPVAGRQDAQP
jgi:hypothetical protein